MIRSSVVAGLLALPSLAPAQVPSIAPPTTVPPVGVPSVGAKTPEVPAQDAHPLTRADVEAWLDGFMPYALQRGDVAGAVVVVIKGGDILLEKGYGYSEVAERKPVDPERTLFRPGSVSKLFTWTAVMQLVEQGKLDLDADINTYLDFKIPPRDGKPITLRNLMTHTPGFDEIERALFVTHPKDLPTLEQALKRWTPPRVTAAGSTPAYSNYGAGLAGYIVQRVSGEAFDDYIERHIFAPLGMTHASFRQPLPAQLQPWMAKGYDLGSGEPKPFEIVTIPPAGSLSASGGDMGRFMIAHLQNGAFGSNRILQEATAIKMHGTPSTMIPPLNRMLLGFYENNINGHRVITHAGDMQWFHTELNLFADDGVGLYVSVNSVGKEGAAGPIRSMLFRQFSDRYFPGPSQEGKVDAKVAKEHAQLMAGRYILSRRSHTTFLTVLNLLGEVKVISNDDGTITIPLLKGPDDQPKKWREVAPFVWRSADAGDRLAAKVENGRVMRFGYDEYPFMVFEPVPWWWSSGWLLPLWVTALVALSLTILAWPVSALVRRRYGVAYGLTGVDAKAHRRVRIASVLVVATMVAWFVTVETMSSSSDWASPATDGWITFLRLLSLVVFVAATVVALWNAWAVLSSERRRLAKLWSVLLAISCVTVLYVGVVFHLVGYSANY
ncbi:MAG: beta-lactamase family protein [Chthoniobacterales bacterium]|nr:beta-lactamase family protein [Chthoniobacterales bacterium]